MRNGRSYQEAGGRHSRMEEVGADYGDAAYAMFGFILEIVLVFIGFYDKASGSFFTP